MAKNNEKIIDAAMMDKLLELVRLKISPEEKKSLSQDLNSVLNYIKELEKIQGLEEISLDPATNLIPSLREDASAKKNTEENLLSGQFRKTENGKLKVPSILKKD